jgi:hypothetical protein
MKSKLIFAVFLAALAIPSAAYAKGGRVVGETTGAAAELVASCRTWSNTIHPQFGRGLYMDEVHRCVQAGGPARMESASP